MMGHTGSVEGRLVENALDAHRLNELQGPEWSIIDGWDGDCGMDSVVNHGARLP